MSYTVREPFVDLMDGNHLYQAGEQYPRPGYTASAERVAELAGAENKVGRSLIKAVERPVETPKEEPKEIPAKPAEAPKRGRRGRERVNEDD